MQQHDELQARLLVAVKDAHRRLNDIIEFLPDATLVIDRQGQVVAWNKAIEQMTGVVKKDMLGKGNYEYAIPFYGQRRPILIDLALLGREQLDQRYDDIWREGDTIFGETYVPDTYQGKGAYLAGAATPFFDEAGQITGAIESIRDITARKKAELALQKIQAELEQRVLARTQELAEANRRLRAEIAEREQAQQALAESEQKYRRMVDSLPQIVFEVDLSGQVVYLNHAAERAGYRQNDITQGLRIEDVIAPTDHQHLQENIHKMLAGDYVQGIEYIFVRKDGSTFPAVAYAQLIIQQQQPTGITGFLIDVTEQKKAKEVLRQAHLELEERVAARTEQLATINQTLRQLLKKQKINIELAQHLLRLINSPHPRNIPLPAERNLFVLSYLIPCHAVGGDHFLVRNLGLPKGIPNRTVISLKDQSGHEVGCILRSILSDLLHNFLLHGQAGELSLATITERLNQLLCASHMFKDEDFFTAINIEIDHETLNMQYLSAGHPPFLLLRGDQVFLLPDESGDGGNLPIGMIAQQEFRASYFPLQYNDRLIIYTDGLLEAPLKFGQVAWKSTDLQQIVRTLLRPNTKLMISNLIPELFQQLTGMALGDATPSSGFKDDIAIIGIEIEAPAGPWEDSIYPANHESLRQWRQKLYESIAAEWRCHGFEKPEQRLRLVLEEAILNAWRHGNGESPQKKIVVRWAYGNDARLDIIDEGSGFDFDCALRHDPISHMNRIRPSGRGLFLIRRVSDEMTFLDGGRQLSLHFGRTCRSRSNGWADANPGLDLWR